MRDGEAQRLARGLRARGAAVVLADEPARFDRSERQTIVYAARSLDRAEAVRAAEQATLATDSSVSRIESHRELGRLLGYPRCCVDAFLSVTSAFDVPGASYQGRDEDVLHAQGALARTAGHPHARLNPLLLSSRIRLVTFYPCRYDCEPALRYADALSTAIARKDRAAALQLDAALACEVILAANGARALVERADDGTRRAAAPPLPPGMPDSRGDQAFAASIDEFVRCGATVESAALSIVFRHPVRS